MVNFINYLTSIFAYYCSKSYSTQKEDYKQALETKKKSKQQDNWSLQSKGFFFFFFGGGGGGLKETQNEYVLFGKLIFS
jgi:hypothetical protein